MERMRETEAIERERATEREEETYEKRPVLYHKAEAGGGQRTHSSSEVARTFGTKKTREKRKKKRRMDRQPYFEKTNDPAYGTRT